MASLYLDSINLENSQYVDETMVKSVGETLTQEDSAIRENVTPATDGDDTPKIDDVTNVGNMVDHASQSLKEKDPESDAGKNVETSGTHEDVVEDYV
ncbi:hypothetical protein A2U01_0059844, partial [Trifolium medium]|nr:hypothetical protein [Trifolium medium]